MEDLIYQYEVALEYELTEELVKELCSTMNIPFDNQKYKQSEMSTDKNALDSVCMLRDVNNENRFIMVDTDGYYIFVIVVRCIGYEHENIKKILVHAYNNAVEGSGWEIDGEIPNVFNDPDSDYEEALKRINVDYI